MNEYKCEIWAKGEFIEPNFRYIKIVAAKDAQEALSKANSELPNVHNVKWYVRDIIMIGKEQP